MRILIVGANGTIGKKVSAYFEKENEVIRAGRTTKPAIDLTDSASIKKLFESIGKLDAIVSIAGEAKWAAFDQLTEEDYYVGFRSKLMGQVNLVRIGQHYLNDGGSFTLTTGILADESVPGTTSASMVNGALHSFVRAAALELKRGQRINVVSSGVVEDAAEKYESFFPGHNPIPMNKVINGYAKSVRGKMSGAVIRMYDNQ